MATRKLTDRQLLKQIAFLMRFPRQQAQNRAMVLSVYFDDLHRNGISEMDRDIVTSHIEKIDALLLAHGYLDKFESGPTYKLLLGKYQDLDD